TAAVPYPPLRSISRRRQLRRANVRVVSADAPPPPLGETSAASILPHFSGWPIAATHILQCGQREMADRLAQESRPPAKFRRTKQKTRATLAASAPHARPQ